MKNILIIEDDVDVQELYLEFLHKRGYKVTLATNGRLGIQLTKKFPTDLVILDLMLPGSINGTGVLQRLKRDPLTKRIPVIILTNLSSEKQRLLKLGAADYLTKTDASLTELDSKIKKLLSS